MVLGTLNGGEAGILERLFTLHAPLCDRLMLLNKERVSEGYSLCVTVWFLVFDLMSASKIAPRRINEFCGLNETEISRSCL